MKVNKKKKYIIIIVSLIFIISLIHCITYTFDKRLIDNGIDPKLSIMTSGLKNGGTTFLWIWLPNN